MKTIFENFLNRKTTLLIAFVIIAAICLFIHPVAGLVTGIFAAPAIEGINRYKTVEDGQYRKMDWWNIAAIWLGTVAAWAVVSVGFLIKKN